MTNLGIRDRFGVRLAVGHATGEFRNLDNEAVVVLAPVNDEFVAHAFTTQGATEPRCLHRYRPSGFRRRDR
jgi:hypothetical protein